MRRVRNGSVEPFPANDAECHDGGVHPHGGAMLDKPEKTRQLLMTLETARLILAESA